MTILTNRNNPDEPTKRSVGKALKLLFFKFIKWDKKTQQLRKVIYHNDGTAERSDVEVKKAVDKANKIVLLVHGIIGDTQQMAEAFRAAKDAGKYDLILTFDYENLNTSILETADLLYNKLVNDLGLLQSSDKTLDIVAHSMGGLVSRYMIEKLGGDKMVRHLYMCGTPNNGSAISELTYYRNMILTLCTVALNFGFAVPALLVGVLTKEQNIDFDLGGNANGRNGYSQTPQNPNSPKQLIPSLQETWRNTWGNRMNTRKNS